jgi:hypothetical protein
VEEDRRDKTEHRRKKGEIRLSSEGREEGQDLTVEEDRRDKTEHRRKRGEIRLNSEGREEG